MMTLRLGSLGFNLSKVGICGSDVAIHGRVAWLIMYSVAEGPRVSYRETV